MILLYSCTVISFLAAGNGTVHRHLHCWMNIINSELVKNRSYLLFWFQQHCHNTNHQYQQFLLYFNKKKREHFQIHLLSSSYYRHIFFIRKPHVFILSKVMIMFLTSLRVWITKSLWVETLIFKIISCKLL